MKSYSYVAEFENIGLEGVGIIEAENEKEAQKDIYGRTGEWLTATNMPFRAPCPVYVGIFSANDPSEVK